MKITPLERRGSLSTGIAEQLKNAILAGELKAGERLPGQRELAMRFGASTASVREAVSVLVAAGLVDVSPGRGTVVCGLADNQPQFNGWLGVPGDTSHINDFLEARRLLEVFIIEKAIERGSSSQFANLHQALAQMESAISDPVKYSEADLAFHQKLAALAGNKVIIRIMNAIQAPMQQALNEGNKLHVRKSGHLRVSFESHVKLVKAIENGNKQVAIDCLDEMIQRATQLLSK